MNPENIDKAKSLCTKLKQCEREKKELLENGISSILIPSYGTINAVDILTNIELLFIQNIICFHLDEQIKILENEISSL